MYDIVTNDREDPFLLTTCIPMVIVVTMAIEMLVSQPILRLGLRYC